MASNVNPTPLTTTPTATGEVEALLEAGARGAGIAPLFTTISHSSAPGLSVPVAVVEEEGDRRVVVLDDVLDALERRLPGPNRRDGELVVTEVDSFIAAVNRWATPTAMIYVQTGGFAFEAVLDDHPAGATGTAWRGHRISYTCPRSAEWKIWTEAEGKSYTQVGFAEFIESRLEDIADPAKLNPKPEGKIAAPLDLLAMARNLQIFTKGTFQRTFDPTTGNSSLVAKTENTAESTEIPRSFMLVIPVFEGDDRYSLEARVRFTMVEGQPRFAFVLHRRAEVERHALDKVRIRVVAETKIPLLAGTP